VRQILCRVFYFGRTAEIVYRAFFIGCTTQKKCMASKLFAVRQEKTCDKDLVCHEFYFLAHGKHFSPTGR
jgi:hypothetical protein